MENRESHSDKMRNALNKKNIWIIKYGMLIASLFIICIIILLEFYLRTIHVSLLDWFEQNTNR